LGQAISHQAVEGKVGCCITEFELGAHDEHAHALQCGGQQIAMAYQQDLGRAAFEADKACLYPAFGVAKSGQAGLVLAQQGEVLRQLAVEKFGGVGAVGAYNAQMGERGDPLEGGVECDGHRLNYHQWLFVRFHKGLLCVACF